MNDMIMNVEPEVKTEAFVEAVRDAFAKGFQRIHVHLKGQYVGMIVRPDEAERLELI